MISLMMSPRACGNRDAQVPVKLPFFHVLLYHFDIRFLIINFLLLIFILISYGITDLAREKTVATIIFIN